MNTVRVTERDLQSFDMKHVQVVFLVEESSGREYELYKSPRPVGTFPPGPQPLRLEIPVPNVDNVATRRRLSQIVRSI